MLNPFLLFAPFLLAISPLQESAAEHAEHAKAEESEFRLESMESPAGPNSSLPNLVKGADGETYLSWVERQADKDPVLRISRLGAKSWGTPMDVVRAKNLMLNWADFPSVQTTASGVIIASWLRQGSWMHGYNAEFRISTDRGKSWGAIQRLHSDDSPGEHGFVSIAPIDKNTFGAIWLDGRAMGEPGDPKSAMRLYFRTISKSGEMGEEVLLDDRVCSCCQTSLVALPQGGLMAAYRDRSGEEVRDISVLHFDGKNWAKPKPAHADGWKISGCPVNGPRLGVGHSLRGITWFTGAGEGEPKAYAKVGGRDFDELHPISIADEKTDGRVDVVPGINDSILVAWMEIVAEGQMEWRLRRISKAGHKGDSIVIAKVPGQRSAGFLRMAPTGRGAVLAWTTGGPDQKVQTAVLKPREI